MKKTILTFALASLGIAAFAAEPASYSAPYTLGAKFAYEGTYVYQGQKRSSTNIQTTLDFSYLAPVQGALDSLDIYTQLFYMSPVTKSDNEAAITLGAKANFAVEYFFDLGYKYLGYPNSGVFNHEDKWRIPVNREHSIYAGLGRNVQFFDGQDWSEVSLSAYGHYNWTREQFVIEVGAEKVFTSIADIENLDLGVKAVYGYSNANRWYGDQVSRNEIPDKTYDYGYFAVSADAIYNVNEVTALSFGIRYAYQNGNNTEYFGSHNHVWCGAAITFRY